MKFIEFVGWYCLVGVLVNIFDLIKGRLLYKEEFQEFEKDMATFSKIGQIQMWVIYDLAWPFLILMDLNDAIKKIRKK